MHSMGERASGGRKHYWIRFGYGTTKIRLTRIISLQTAAINHFPISLIIILILAHHNTASAVFKLPM